MIVFSVSARVVSDATQRCGISIESGPSRSRPRRDSLRRPSVIRGRKDTARCRQICRSRTLCREGSIARRRGDDLNGQGRAHTQTGREEEFCHLCCSSVCRHCHAVGRSVVIVVEGASDRANDTRADVPFSFSLFHSLPPLVAFVTRVFTLMKERVLLFRQTPISPPPLRSITSGVDRSEGRRDRVGRQRGQLQNPLGNQSSTALQSVSPSDVAAADERRTRARQKEEEERERIRTRFDAAAAAEDDDEEQAGRENAHLPILIIRCQQVKRAKTSEFNVSCLHFRHNLIT